MSISYVDLGSQWREIREQALLEIDRILASGKYLEHSVIEELEYELARFLGVKHVVTLNSGTDALLMSLKILEIEKGDEVITVPNSFIASVAAIQHVGAKPIFIDVGPDHLLNTDEIESLITPRTKAIMPVHLEGKMSDTSQIWSLAKKFGLKVIEDAAQAIGSNFNQIKPGNASDVACFSLHPLKNLNGIGDGGFIATNYDHLAERVMKLRNHGQKNRNHSEEFGFVSRMDSIQAAIVRIRLNKLESVISKRRKLASFYFNELSDYNSILPKVKDGSFHTYHLFVIECFNRDEVRTHLSHCGIETRVHYPQLITEQVAFREKYKEPIPHTPLALQQSRRIVSLPIHQHLKESDIEFIAKSLKQVLH